MHEYAITENIVAMVLEEAKRNSAKKIININITLGELSSVIPECVEMYFELLAKGTYAEQAKLKFKIIPTEMECIRCGERFLKNKSNIECPKCNEFGRFTDKGKEIFIESIEIE